MKRALAFSLCWIILLSILFPSVHAAGSHAPVSEYPENEVQISREVYRFANGTSCVITVSQAASETRGTVKTVTGTKTYTARDEDLAVLWTFCIHGTFSVNTGVSSSCTAASYSYNIVNTDWSFASGTATPSGNKAIGHGEFERNFLFITLDTMTCDVTLTCSVNGVLS